MTDELHLRSRLAAFAEKKTVPHAADVVGTAWILGRPGEATQAAQLLLREKSAPEPAKDLARTVLGESDPPKNEISRDSVEIRRRLRHYSRNPFAWVDLALVRANQGDLQGSERAINVALRLAPHDRFVLRSAARFFVHADAPDRAHDLLIRSPSISLDPWLIAAEIAVAGVAGRRSREVRSGRQIAESGNFLPLHTAELFSAIGTLEAEVGNARKARQWLRRALKEPTENAIAQGVWLSRRDPGLRDLVPEAGEAKEARAWEAAAFAAFQKANWKESLKMTIQWHEDEPFSSRPASHGSFVAGTALFDWNESLRFADLGLAANPTDQVLLNNRAFALANTGRLAEAEDTINLIDLLEVDDAVNKLHIKATRGAILFAKGDAVAGERLYREVISEAERRRLRSVRARASIFLAGAMIRERMFDSAAPLILEVTKAVRELESGESREIVAAALHNLQRLRTKVSGAIGS